MEPYELRSELRFRGLSVEGSRAELEARLLQAVKRDADLHARLASSGQKRRQEQQHAPAAASCSTDLLKQLDCPVCLELITPPIYQCESGHVICSSCRAKLPRPKRCPECRVLLSATRCLVLERMAENLMVPCPNCAKGCEQVVPYHQLERHRLSCDYRPLQCKECDCEWRGSFLELAEHFASARNHFTQDIELGRAFEDPLFSVKRGDDIDLDFTDVTFFDAGEARFILVAAGNARREHIALHVFFVGPEKNRESYDWTVELKEFRGDSFRMVMGGGMRSCHETDLSKPRFAVPSVAIGTCADAEGHLPLFFTFRRKQQQSQ